MSEGFIMVGGPMQGEFRKTQITGKLSYDVCSVVYQGSVGFDTAEDVGVFETRYKLEKLYITVMIDGKPKEKTLRIWLHESVPITAAHWMLELMREENLLPIGGKEMQFLNAFSDPEEWGSLSGSIP